MSQTSLLDKLTAIMPCDDNTCCCIPRRSSVIIISIINFFGCIADLVAIESCVDGSSDARDFPDSARKLLASLFQVANLLLLLSSIFEIVLLVDIYVWYALGFIVMGLVVSLYEFVVKMQRDTPRSCLITFIPDVIFFFVIFRCLPLVDVYRRHLYRVAATHKIR